MDRRYSERTSSAAYRSRDTSNPYRDVLTATEEEAEDIAHKVGIVVQD
jgi:hypothetical protein